MHAAIGTAAATLLAVTATVTWNAKSSRTTADAPAVIAMEPGHDPVPSSVPDPIEASDVELSTPTAFTRTLLEGVDRIERAMDPALGGAPSGAGDSDEQAWSAELFHTLALSPAIESLAVNASSGDIEVVESRSGNVEIRARVRAQLDRVSKQDLVQVFERHVDVIEDEKVLHIEDKHRDSRGWKVSFVVHVPGAMPLSANSGSGDIVVRRARGEVHANTGSGDVKIELPRERVSKLAANTGSGNVIAEIHAIEKALDLNTGSGDVTLRVQDVSSPGAARLNSGSGDARLIVPPGINGSFDLETNGDAIRLAPALGLQEQVAKDGRRRVQGSVGGGGGKYKLTSGTGELEIEIGYELPVKPK